MKRWGIGVGLVVLLLLVAILLLPFFIDLNKYKDQYQPVIEDALNRKVVLNDLKLTLLPRIGVRIAGFTVMDDPAFSQVPFASLESLEIGIKLMPLLGGHVEIEEIILKTPLIFVMKNRHGLLNVSTIGKRGIPPARAPKEAPQPPPQEAPLRALALLAVDRVTLVNGRLVYQDQSTPTPTEYTVRDLTVRLESVRLGDMPRVHVEAVVQPFNLPLKIDGVVGPLVETLDLKTIDAALALGSNTATITGSAVGGHATLTVSSPIISTAHLPMAHPPAKPIEIRDLHAEAETNYPPRPNTPALEALTVKVLRCAIVLNHSTITVNGHVLDGEGRLMAVSPSLNVMDLPIALRLRKPIEVTDVKLSAGMKGQYATVDNLSLNVFGGQLTSQAGLALESSPRFDGTVNLHGVQLGPIVEALMDRVTASGTANAHIALQGRGFSKLAVMSALEGKGSFAVKDGSIEGVNLAQEAVALLKAAGVTLDTKATVFSTIEGNFGIKHGMIDVERFLMESHDFQATGAGAIGFDQSLNLTATLHLSETLSHQIASGTPVLRAAMSAGRMTVPMLITGTVQAPVYGLDTKALTGRVQEQVKEHVTGAIDDLLKGKKPDLKKSKDTLKHLFGR